MWGLRYWLHCPNVQQAAARTIGFASWYQPTAHERMLRPKPPQKCRHISKPHATCNMQHATCNMQHATCNRQGSHSHVVVALSVNIETYPHEWHQQRHHAIQGLTQRLGTPFCNHSQRYHGSAAHFPVWVLQCGHHTLHQAREHMPGNQPTSQPTSQPATDGATTQTRQRNASRTCCCAALQHGKNNSTHWEGMA